MTQLTPLLGVSITDTPTSNVSGHQLGTRVEHSDGQVYTYVTASAAITQYDFVGIDENFAAAPLTDAMAQDGWEIGVAQVAFASGDYGWVCTKGSNVTGFVKASCAADVALYTSATAGKLDDASTGVTKIEGVVLVTANSSNTARAKEVLLTFPRSTSF
jgi:hypothetical protein